MRRKRPYTEPDRIKGRIQAVKTRHDDRLMADAKAQYKLDTLFAQAKARRFATELANGLAI